MLGTDKQESNSCPTLLFSGWFDRVRLCMTQHPNVPRACNVVNRDFCFSEMMPLPFTLQASAIEEDLYGEENDELMASLSEQDKMLLEQENKRYAACCGLSVVCWSMTALPESASASDNRGVPPTSRPSLLVPHPTQLVGGDAAAF
jgi:hypothetical protein